MDDISELRNQVSELREQLDSLNSSTQSESFTEKLLTKLSEQGTWRGIIMIVMAILPQFSSLINVDILLNVFTGLAMIYGVQNIATEG